MTSETSVASERRSEPRGATVFRPILVETSDFAGFCLVRNLSEHGMLAKTYAHFDTDLPLTIHFSSRKLVEGRAIWCDDELLGVAFEEAIDVAEVLADLAKKDHDGKLNRPLRLPISAVAELAIEKRSFPANVHDISQRGIKVSTYSLHTGEEPMVRLAGLDPRKAAVRWTYNGMAGLNFIRPLSFDQLARWVIQQQLTNEHAVVPLAEASLSESGVGQSLG